MKKLIICLIAMLSFLNSENLNLEVKKSNTKYEFGKNVDLIGTWEVTSNGAFSTFIFGVFSKEMIKFAKNGAIYKIEKGKEIISDSIWKINSNGKVIVNKNNEYYEKANLNQKSMRIRALKEIITGTLKQEFSIIEKAPNSCFIIENDIKMCKISGKVYLDSDKKIQIEIN